MTTMAQWMESNPFLSQMNASEFEWKVSTDRYCSRAYGQQERQNLWMNVWQIAGRADELTDIGSWMEYRLFDQSWILVRGRDSVIRGFVNACRHRGNILCQGRGQSSRFQCPYHNWTFGLEGQLAGLAKPDFDGSLEDFVGPKDDLGLIEVPVETFAGFIFINPDPEAAPLAEFLGDAAPALAAYPLETMVPVDINVRERIECNWKVIMDAFGEGYHTQGVHKELVGVVDLQKERFQRFGVHSISTTPFGQPGFDQLDDEIAVDTLLNIPTSHFPGFIDVLPRFAELVKEYRSAEGKLNLPSGLTPRKLFQQAVRSNLNANGFDVSQLADCQMMDYQFWLLFPNVFIQICAGEATIIIAEPDPDENPNRCFWRVMTLRCLPEAQRQSQRAPFQQIAEEDHYPYFLALEQDFQQMAKQQLGLRNTTLSELVLTRQEPRVANFHSALNQWVGPIASPSHIISPLTNTQE